MSHGYWPTGVNDEMCVGKLSVTLISEKQRKDYIERKLRIKEDEVGVSIWDEVGVSIWDEVGVSIWDEVGVSVWVQWNLQMKDILRLVISPL